MRIIDADALFEEINEAYDLNYGETLIDPYRFAEMVENAPTIEQPTWISVEDGLPETIVCSAGTAYSEAVNVLTSGRKVITALFDGEEFICDAEFWGAENEEVTHWTPVLLPLPKAPKGDE